MKILIIGSVGSGKTTLAKKISNKLEIPYYEIDSIVYNDIKKEKRLTQEQDNIIKNINKNNSWIIEGTLRKNLNYLLDLSDKIIYLNTNYNIRKIRIIKRYIKQKLKLEKISYKSNLKLLIQMYKWNKEFEINKDEFEHQLTKYNDKLINKKELL
jgi:adenylate kinase family enzyme